MKFSEFYENYFRGAYLIENENDEIFRNQANKIVKDTIDEYKKLKTKDIHLEEYDLQVTIGISTTSTLGFFTLIKKSQLPIIFINAAKGFTEEYNNGDFSSIIEGRKSILFHEVVHFLNYMGWKGADHPHSMSKDEYLQGMEFNAYFHQTAEVIKNEIRKYGFEKVCGENSQQFFKYFLEVLSSHNMLAAISYANGKDYRWKLMKRAYQLYFELNREFNKDLDIELNEKFKDYRRK